MAKLDEWLGKTAFTGRFGDVDIGDIGEAGAVRDNAKIAHLLGPEAS